MRTEVRTREDMMGIDFGKLRECSAQEKKVKEEEKQPTKDLSDALEELNLPGGMLAGRPPMRRGSVPKKKDE